MKRRGKKKGSKRNNSKKNNLRAFLLVIVILLLVGFIIFANYPGYEEENYGGDLGSLSLVGLIKFLFGKDIKYEDAVIGFDNVGSNSETLLEDEVEVEVNDVCKTDEECKKIDKDRPYCLVEFGCVECLENQNCKDANKGQYCWESVESKERRCIY